MIVAQVATVGREEDNVAINMKKVDNCYCYCSSKTQNINRNSGNSGNSRKEY